MHFPADVEMGQDDEVKEEDGEDQGNEDNMRRKSKRFGEQHTAKLPMKQVHEQELMHQQLGSTSTAPVSEPGRVIQQRCESSAVN